MMWSIGSLCYLGDMLSVDGSAVVAVTARIQWVDSV